MRGFILQILFLLLAGSHAQDDSTVDGTTTSNAQRALRQGAEQACIARELIDFHDHFDAVEYRNKVLADAGITQEDVREAKQEYGRDVDDLTQSTVVQALTQSIQRHSGELEQVQHIIKACEVEAAGGASAAGIGTEIGMMFAASLQEDSSTPAPSPELGFTDVSTHQTEQDFTFVGFHIEAGALLDLSLSVFWHPGTAATEFQICRFCFGAELGGGAELSVLFMFYRGLEPADYQCSSVIIEAELGATAAVGLAVGWQTDSADADKPPHYEVTIGVGGGFGIGGALCWA